MDNLLFAEIARVERQATDLQGQLPPALAQRLIYVLRCLEIALLHYYGEDISGLEIPVFAPTLAVTLEAPAKPILALLGEGKR